jgi:Uncharacterised protein family UPF0102
MPATAPKKHLGVRGENFACAKLERQDMRVLERNWRCRLGEIEIVAAEAAGKSVADLGEHRPRSPRSDLLGSTTLMPRAGVADHNRHGFGWLCHATQVMPTSRSRDESTALIHVDGPQLSTLRACNSIIGGLMSKSWDSSTVRRDTADSWPLSTNSENRRSKRQGHR